VSGFSAAAGCRSDQFDRTGNFFGTKKSIKMLTLAILIVGATFSRDLLGQADTHDRG
jgi:hypothetical protein